MRMSVNKDDPGYHKKAQYYQPFLNGKKVDLCYTADEDMGYLLRHKTDNSGQVIVDWGKGETVKEQLFGHVEIRRVK